MSTLIITIQCTVLIFKRPLLALFGKRTLIGAHMPSVEWPTLSVISMSFASHTCLSSAACVPECWQISLGECICQSSISVCSLDLTLFHFWEVPTFSWVNLSPSRCNPLKWSVRSKPYKLHYQRTHMKVEDTRVKTRRHYTHTQTHTDDTPDKSESKQKDALWEVPLLQQKDKLLTKPWHQLGAVFEGITEHEIRPTIQTASFYGVWWKQILWNMVFHVGSISVKNIKEWS